MNAGGLTRTKGSQPSARLSLGAGAEGRRRRVMTARRRFKPFEAKAQLWPSRL